MFHPLQLNNKLIFWLFLFHQFSVNLTSIENNSLDSEDISKSLHSLEHSEENRDSEENKDSEENGDESENSEEESCRLDVNEDLPKKNEPLILIVDEMNNTDLVLPEVENNTGVITLKAGEEVMVACPGSNNYIEETKDEFNTLICNSGTIFTMSGEYFKFQNLDCHSRPEATIKVTSRACARGKGAVVEIGFEIAGWHKLIEVCHNFAVSSTYYSRHTIHGSRLAGKVLWTAGRPSFLKGGGELFQGINPDKAYTQKNQVAVMERLLGKERGEDMIDIKSGSYLVRSLLTPDTDFLLSPHRLITYSYANAAPQWYTINSGSWLLLQEHIRQVVTKRGVELEVVTGTFGVLRLLGVDGVRQIALLGSKIPVPEFFWKLIRNPQDDSCIAFIISNNPFAKARPRRLCRDVCASTHWPVYQSNYSEGYVYCCEYSSIKRTLRDIPALQCNSSLNGQYK